MLDNKHSSLFKLPYISGGENKAGPYYVFQYLGERQSTIQIFCDKTLLHSPDENAILIIVATSSNPLN